MLTTVAKTKSHGLIGEQILSIVSKLCRMRSSLRQCLTQCWVFWHMEQWCLSFIRNKLNNWGQTSPTLVQEWSVPPGAAWSLSGFLCCFGFVCFLKWLYYEYRNESSLYFIFSWVCIKCIYPSRLPRWWSTEPENAALAARHTIGDKSGMREKAARKSRLEGSNTFTTVSDILYVFKKNQLLK